MEEYCSDCVKMDSSVCSRCRSRRAVFQTPREQLTTQGTYNFGYKIIQRFVIKLSLGRIASESSYWSLSGGNLSAGSHNSIPPDDWEVLWFNFTIVLEAAKPLNRVENHGENWEKLSLFQAIRDESSGRRSPNLLRWLWAIGGAIR